MSREAHNDWSLCVFLCVLVMSIAGCTAYSSQNANECGEVQSKEATK